MNIEIEIFIRRSKLMQELFLCMSLVYSAKPFVIDYHFFHEIQIGISPIVLLPNIEYVEFEFLRLIQLTAMFIGILISISF